MKRMKEDNSGFSLVELLVTIAIFSIVATAIFEFLMVSIRHYQKEQREVEVQYEAQLTMNQLQDMVIDAKKGVWYAYSNNATPQVVGTLIDSDADIPGGMAAFKQLLIFDDDMCYMVVWSAAESKLFYYEFIKNASGAFELDPNVNGLLMAEYIKGFSADLTFFDRNNGIGLSLLFENGRYYQVMQNVKLRNQVSVNATLAQMYG